MARRRQGLKAQMRTYNHIARQIKADLRLAMEGRPGDTEHHGRIFKTREFRSVDDANAFMARNPGWGAIGQSPEYGERPTRVWVARKEDVGERP